jgi:uncharacterized protein YbjT (DUF2867 family)
MSTPTPQPAILVLGGTGTVGSRIVEQLSSSSHPHRILVASRNGSTNNSTPSNPSESSSKSNTKIQHVPFDWHNADTWSNPFSLCTATEATINTKITAIYLIAPPSLDADSLMTAFIDFARQEPHGVRRFVLQSASSIEEGGPAMGKVHAYLRELGERGEVEWACLRPTWFQRTSFLILS